ncbi:MAG: hypothetical protein LIO43_00160 [Clostridiales bacterium]|nr:hypothetical protein [Clostridiales bacterium]
MNFYIKIGSITNAQRARGVLQKNSIKCVIKRIENPQPGDGFGYAVSVSDNDVNSAVNYIEKSGMRILGVDEN